MMRSEKPHPRLIEIAQFLARRAVERDYERLLKTGKQPFENDDSELKAP